MTEKAAKSTGGRPKKDLSELIGTPSGYLNHGLRDPDSKAAWAKYIQQTREKKREAKRAKAAAA